MEGTSTSSDRIVKNTIILYGRMLLMMFIGFFTSRLVLQSLGVTDYGILNIVAGLITMFTMVSDTFSITISRFITYNLGKGDFQKLKTIFSTSVNIQLILSIFIIILMETIGLWFLETKLVIPEERMFAARCCYQLSIISFVIGLISVPYNAEIISHEKMDVFAYFSLFEAFAKLLIAVLILFSTYDKLILYSFLLVLVEIIKRLFYGYYCTKHFTESKYKFVLDKKIMIEMSKFSGWNFMSSGAVVLRVQGTNIMLNMFFGPAMNAAKGLANQLNNLLNGFVSNFMVAINPQITKNYAVNNMEYMKRLAFQGAKFSYFIFLFFSVPILCDTHFVLSIWLKEVPNHSVLFVQLIVIYTLLDTLSKTLRTAIYATGQIARFQIYVTIVELLNLPISYIFLIKGAIPEVVTVINIILAQICLVVKIFLARDQLGFSIREFFKEIYFKAIYVSFFAFIFPIIIFVYMPESLIRFIIICMLSIVFTGISIYFVGCNNGERIFIKKKFLSFKKHVYY